MCLGGKNFVVQENIRKYLKYQNIVAGISDSVGESLCLKQIASLTFNDVLALKRLSLTTVIGRSVNKVTLQQLDRCMPKGGKQQCQILSNFALKMLLQSFVDEHLLMRHSKISLFLELVTMIRKKRIFIPLKTIMAKFLQKRASLGQSLIQPLTKNSYSLHDKSSIFQRKKTTCIISVAVTFFLC